MEMAKVTSKGQITIPVSIRRRLDIQEGDKILFIDSVEGVIMVNPDKFQERQTIDSPVSGASRNLAAELPEDNGDYDYAAADESTDTDVSTNTDAESITGNPYNNEGDSNVPNPETTAQQDTPTPMEITGKVEPTMDSMQIVADNSQNTTENPQTVTDASRPKSETQVKGVNISALLDDIRSIGKRI